MFYQRVFLQVLLKMLCTRMKMGSGSLIWLIIPPLRKRLTQKHQRTLASFRLRPLSLQVHTQWLYAIKCFSSSVFYHIVNY